MTAPAPVWFSHFVSLQRGRINWKQQLFHSWFICWLCFWNKRFSVTVRAVIRRERMSIITLLIHTPTHQLAGKMRLGAVFQPPLNNNTGEEDRLKESDREDTDVLEDPSAALQSEGKFRRALTLVCFIDFWHLIKENIFCNHPLLC